MGMICTVCRAPARDEINRKILSNEPLMKLTTSYNLSYGALHRHKTDCLSRSVERAAEKEDISVLHQVRNLVEQCQKISNDCLQEKDRRTAISALREVSRNLALVAQLTGELEQAPSVTVAVQVNLSEQELELQIAEHVRQATNDFDPDEIRRLKRLLEPPMIEGTLDSQPNVLGKAESRQ
jgi:hypothetical protein